MKRSIISYIYCHVSIELLLKLTLVSIITIFVSIKAYGSTLGEKWVQVVNGKKSKPYPQIWDPTFSPDNKQLAFWARHIVWEGPGKPDKLKMIVNGKENEIYAYADYPQSLDKLFSDTYDKRLSISDIAGSKDFVIIDENK